MKTIFTNKYSELNYRYLNPVFVNIFNYFLKSIHTDSIEINSTYRPKEKSNHSRGIALDINSIITDKGKYSFNVNDIFYTNETDIAFFNLAKFYFNESLIEYYSPSKIFSKSNNINRLNQYYNKTRSDKIYILNSIEEKKRNLDQSHLNHLHIAISPKESFNYDEYLSKIFEKNKSNNKNHFIEIGLFLLTGFIIYNHIKKQENDNGSKSISKKNN